MKQRTTKQILKEGRFDAVEWIRAVRREAMYLLLTDPKKYLERLEKSTEKLKKMA